MPPSPLKTISGPRVLAYRENGTGEAVVFLHGIGSSSEGWEAQLAHFGKTYRAIAWDAPGYGGSGEIEPLAPAAADYADALAALLDGLGVGRAHLVGNSLGALMAAAFARRYPARVASLVLSDAATGHARLGEEERNEKLMQRLDDVAEFGMAGMAKRRAPKLLGSRADPGALNKVVSIMSRIKPKPYGQAARMLSLGDTIRELEGCRARTLVICGAEDVVTPPESNRRIAKAANAHYLELDGAGHLPYLEVPDEFNEAVGNFIAAREEFAP